MRAEIEGGAFILAIEDSGNGLPERAKNFLMGENPGPVPVVEGSGIGLWMVQRLMAEIDGTIQIGQSQLGGAKITCTIILERQSKVFENAA